MSGGLLPALEAYPERLEPPEAWSDRIEAALTEGPRALAAALGRRRLDREAAAVDALEPELRRLGEDALRDELQRLRAALRCGATGTPAVARTFALVREQSRRVLGLRHHRVQLLGGLAMLRGMVAEMDTGEGKTLTATLAVAAAALSGRPVHVVTVNDYLAERDALTLAPLYRALGLSVGTITHGLPPEERRAAYGCDVTYASNKEIAFDYLRDRLVLGTRPRNLWLKLRRLQGDRTVDRRVVMRGLHFAIVDEADSVLVDEARTPLIISRESDAEAERLWAEEALDVAAELAEGEHYRVLREERRIELTAAGRERLARVTEDREGGWRSRIRREEAARQALSALHLFHRGDHYLVKDDSVQIVDEYTGRLMADRSWSDGMHQIIEAKEGCAITSRKVPMARMTYQRFFRRYRALAGMTGTAREVSGELWSVYRLRVLRVPSHRPSRRRRLRSVVCTSAAGKWERIVARTAALQAVGRPVLIGTRSVNASNVVSALLARSGVEHVVLNAEQDAHEAEIVARAGEPGRVTVATNMAGRGVDILLGPDVAERGGLHVILSERHDARRIDRQLEGRAGRRGEPGTAEAIVSLEDPLLELLPGGWVRSCNWLPRWLLPAAGLVALAAAQRRAERAHSLARRDLLAQDRRLGVLLAFSGGLE